MKLSRLGLACLTAGALALTALTACTPPKYVHYWSLWRDWHASVPWGWNVMTDQEGAHFASTNLIGPFAPEFYLGVPSISVRWHQYKTAHRLPDGLVEYYRDADDYVAQTLKTVYGPTCAQFWDERHPPRSLPSVEADAIDRPCVLVEKKPGGGLQARGKPDLIYTGDGRKAQHFIVLSPVTVPGNVRYGTSVDPKSGRKYVVRMHEYAVLPMEKGFYVVIYPATRAGYDLFKPQFNEFLNTFKVAKEGPQTAQAGPAAPVARAKR